MSPDRVLAWDVGTSGAKVALTDLDARVVASEYAAYAPSYLPDGGVEHDLREILEALRRATRRLLARTGAPSGSIAGIGVTGQMFNLVAVDRTGEPLLPMLSWLDLRAVPQTRALESWMDREEQFRRLGSVVTAKDVIPKILWLQQERPAAWSLTSKLLDCKDAVALHLTGEATTDRSTASSFRLLDRGTAGWDQDACAALGIPSALLPEVGEASRIGGSLSRSAARELGLLAGLPVAVGTGDVGATQVGAGAIRPGAAHLSVGTAIYLGITVPDPLADPARRLGPIGHMVRDQWILWLEIATGGAALTWLVRAVADATKAGRSISHATIEQLVAAAEPDMAGLLFAPWLSGERVLFDDDVRGAFVGLGLHHRLGHLLRAVVEGVASEVRWAFDYALAFGHPIGEIRAVGGGTLGDVWLQTLADMLGRPLVTVSNPQDAGARGAAACVLVALGERPDFSFVSEVVTLGRTVAPRPDRRARMDELYSRFQGLYKALRPIM